MKIKIDNKLHENAYFKSRGYNTTFVLCDSICKTHFKALMRITKMYDAKTKSGFILDSDLPEFKILADKIEKSDETVARRSHEKTIEQKRRKIRAIDFEDYVEDFLDQSIALMSENEIAAAKIGYNEIVDNAVAHEKENKQENIETKKTEEKQDITEEIFTYFVKNGFKIEKGENERYFIVRSEKTEGELIGVLSTSADERISARFDKNEFGTTLSISERSEIHKALSAIYQS
ncbi:MAG: hypothetical protein JNL77_03140 [Nitrosomonas sp.]|nr:hypothetical protein [Nitrosomonas sp.]